MNKREEILNEALVQNDYEIERWTRYKEEQNSTILNLDSFSKKLEIDVMVPIGTKSFIPGKLCHTNEVFVNHYGKFFSNCTVYEAKKICQHRIDMAKNHLEKLSSERELFTNKLTVPYIDGVVANDGEFEIIEKYDEENEKIWQAEHKISLRESIKKENLERNTSSDINHDNVMDMLNELELMDELETELDDLGVQDNDTLQKLISGEIKIPEKKRISNLNSSNTIEKNSKIISNSHNTTILKERLLNEEIPQNKNIYENEFKLSDIKNRNLLDDISDDSDESSTYEVPEEIKAMEKEIEDLLPKEQIKFYKINLKKIENEIDCMKITNPIELDKKMYKIEIRDYLIDLVSILEDQIEETVDINENINLKKKTKRITFALQDEIKYIDNTVKVENMFKTDNEKKRDVINLDSEFDFCKPELKENSLCITANKKYSIAEKVQNNLDFVQETQSFEDFDMVDKILGKKNQKSNTLMITFNHSPQIYQNQINNINFKDNNEFHLSNPADFYKLYAKEYPQNLSKDRIYENKEELNNEAYKDLRTEICSLQNEKIKLKQISSILKNKDYSLPSHVSETKDDNVSFDHFEYDSVVGDVVENRITVPELLPEEKFVDSHAPKKRISRFKKSRCMKAV